MIRKIDFKNYITKGIGSKVAMPFSLQNKSYQYPNKKTSVMTSKEKQAMLKEKISMKLLSFTT